MITSRREFLQIGIAAGALPFTARAASLEWAPPSAGAVPLYKAVYDVRFAPSGAFAERLAELGVAVHAIEGDVTRFWYDDLYHVWKNGPVAIAGLTAHGPLFCLERLAWEQRMRTVFRAEHRLAGDRVDHEITGPLAMMREARREEPAESWAVRMADAAARCPSGRAEIAHAQYSSAWVGAAARDALYTWVIAPVTKS